MAEVERREFLRQAPTALAGASLIGTHRAWADANDRIRIAGIGLGRGRGLMMTASQLPGVEVATVCDPDEERMARCSSTLEEKTGKKPKHEADLRRIMDDKSIDAIVICTCNHWHALAGIWGCQAGKHVFVEKPVCHNMFEGRKLVEAARKYNRLVQGGTQRRSLPVFRKAIQFMRDGGIGEVYMAKYVLNGARDSIGFKQPEPPPPNLHWDLWLGPAPPQPFHRNLVHYNWHWFWDFGNGEMGNNGSHCVDVARWGLNKELPVKIHSVGGRFGYKDQAQTPNMQTTTFEYDDGKFLVAEIRGLYSGEDGWHWHFYGTKGYLHIPSGSGFVVYMGRNKQPEPDIGKLDPSERVRDVDVVHFGKYVEALRAGKREMLTAEINEIYLSTALCLLGNISYRLGRELRFNPATERFIADSEADRLLTREYRKPFIVPEKV